MLILMEVVIDWLMIGVVFGYIGLKQSGWSRVLILVVIFWPVIYFLYLTKNSTTYVYRQSVRV